MHGTQTHWLGKTASKIYDRHIRSWYTECHSSQLAKGIFSDHEKCHQYYCDIVTNPFSSGITLPTALAAPVLAGMMFCAAPRPSRHF